MNGGSSPPAVGRRALAVLAVAGALLAALVVALASRGQAGPQEVRVRALADGRAVVSWSGVGDRYVVTMQSGRQVRRSVVAGWDSVVDGLTVGRRYVTTVTAEGRRGRSAEVDGGTITALGAVAPAPPAAVWATGDPSGARVTVRWTAASQGPAAEAWSLTVVEAGRVAGTTTCYAPCRRVSLNVEPGQPVAVDVAATNLVGRSEPVASNTVPVPRGCRLACVDVDATRPAAPLRHVGGGLLHSPALTAPAQATLHPPWWRVAAVHGASAAMPLGEDEVASRTRGVAITELLSDDWQATHRLPTGYAVPPWTVLVAYGAWVSAEVHALTAAGVRIQWWDVQNEPFNPGYYSPGPPTAQSGAGGVGETGADLEAQWLTAYRAIKAVDPAAAVLSPSFGAWASGSAEASEEYAGSLDLRSFLDFAVLHGVRPDGIVWHDDNSGPDPDAYAPTGGLGQPSAVINQVAVARQLLAERPSLGDPPILINEYGSPATSLQPGWDVGWLAALETSGASEANRACYSTCFDGSADGLLTANGSAARAGYWVYAFAAAMAGRTVPVTTSVVGVSGLASVTPNGRVAVLVGRHQGCQSVGPACPDPTAMAAQLSIRVPWGGRALVTTTSIPPVPGVLAGPVSPVNVTIPVVDGVVRLSSPPLADGGAVEVSISR